MFLAIKVIIDDLGPNVGLMHTKKLWSVLNPIIIRSIKSFHFDRIKSPIHKTLVLFWLECGSYFYFLRLQWSLFARLRERNLFCLSSNLIFVLKSVLFSGAFRVEARDLLCWKHIWFVEHGIPTSSAMSTISQQAHHAQPAN